MSYPVQHISFSSMRLYHTNPGGWKEKYILGNNYYKQTPAAMVGKMAHAVIEEYMKGNKDIQAVQAQQIELFNSIPDEHINFGKTGSREKVLQDFGNALKMYFEEMPDYHNIISVEEKLEATITDVIDGRTIISPLPFVGYTDMIFEEHGQLIVEDYKFKIAHTKDEEGPHPLYWTQANFYYHLVKAKYGRAPKEIRFREIKIGKNKDGSSQHNVIIINFESEEFKMNRSFFWYQIMGMLKAIEDVDADTYFMYNTFDMLTGREAYQLMLQTQFGYTLQPNEQTDLVKVQREEIKTTRFLETDSEDKTVEERIVRKFLEFNVALQFSHKQEGHAFDRYLFTPSRGVTMASVKKYIEDVAQATEVENIRIMAPVPGTKFVGVELPREKRKFEAWDGVDVMPIGVDIEGKKVFFDLSDASTPHLMVAGSTGSGKSQFLNVLIRSRPANTDLYLIDPKIVELQAFYREAKRYETTAEKAFEVLQELITTMENRYKEMGMRGKKNIADMGGNRIMCFIEEYANLRLSDFGGAIEEAVEKLTNMGRAAGIHLIIATQRPDVKIISGRIKNNIGTRVCFSVASSIDSTVILEKPGAEKLSGKGDMLFLYPGKEVQRLQSFYIPEQEDEKEEVPTTTKKSSKKQK